MTSEKEQFYIQRISELEDQLKRRDERIAALEKQVAELIKVNAELVDRAAELSKNSSNSSKPPSPDSVKPQRNTKSNTPRKIGAQPGHTKHERPFFTTEEIDDFQTHTLDACPDCGGILTLVKDASRVVQQVEIVEKPVNIEQHTGLCYWCEHCQNFHYPPMPAISKKAVWHRYLADRFRKHGEAYFRFITTPGIEPTNNVAEQAMRFVVIDCYITQRTRSKKVRT